MSYRSIGVGMPFEFSFGARARGMAAPGWVLLAVLLVPSAALYAEATEPVPADADLKAQQTEYLKKLTEYRKARLAYEKVAVPYWKTIGEKRSQRLKKLANDRSVTSSDYVLEQPPVYTGPPEPQ